MVETAASYCGLALRETAIPGVRSAHGGWASERGWKSAGQRRLCCDQKCRSPTSLSLTMGSFAGWSPLRQNRTQDAGTWPAASPCLPCSWSAGITRSATSINVGGLGVAWSVPLESRFHYSLRFLVRNLGFSCFYYGDRSHLLHGKEEGSQPAQQSPHHCLLCGRTMPSSSPAGSPGTFKQPHNSITVIIPILQRSKLRPTPK